MIVACGMARCRIASRMARRVREGLVPGMAAGMIVVCRMARCRIACGMARRLRTSRRVPYGPMPDRVRYGPSPTHVSSCPSPSVPVVVTVGHVARPSSAMPRPNIRLSPTPPTAVYERLFFYMAVAFHECPFGGAAKADRWAALIP